MRKRFHFRIKILNFLGRSPLYRKLKEPRRQQFVAVQLRNCRQNALPFHLSKWAEFWTIWFATALAGFSDSRRFATLTLGTRR